MVDAYVRVSLVGIELLTVDARIVIASVDTYLRYAGAVGRLDLLENAPGEGVPELLETGQQRAYEAGTKGAIEGLKEGLGINKSDRRE